MQASTLQTPLFISHGVWCQRVEKVMNCTHGVCTMLKIVFFVFLKKHNPKAQKYGSTIFWKKSSIKIAKFQCLIFYSNWWPFKSF
jgi:hypothetical protein